MLKKLGIISVRRIPVIGGNIGLAGRESSSEMPSGWRDAECSPICHASPSETHQKWVHLPNLGALLLSIATAPAGDTLNGTPGISPCVVSESLDEPHYSPEDHVAG